MANHLTDAALLERFVTRREEAAFTALMQRHASEVRSACRRILRSEHDADDVVQLTFLVLATRAADIPWRDSVVGWLCGVARRLSIHVRAGTSKRSCREVTGLTRFPERYHPQSDSWNEFDRRDLRGWLDGELRRLPEKYRDPVVLCDLEGLTHAEAARQLGLPTGSMSRRLETARALLRRRLVTQGFPLSLLLLGVILIGLRFSVREPRPVRWNAVHGMMTSSQDRARREGRDLSALISRLESNSASRDEILSVAQHAIEAAETIESVNPGHDRSLWRSLSGELRTSALGILKESKEVDAPAMLSALRRVNKSCVKCHVTFVDPLSTKPERLETSDGFLQQRLPGDEDSYRMNGT